MCTARFPCQLSIVLARSQVVTVKAKFHYAILVAHRSEACRRPTARCGIWPITSSEIARASRSATSLGLVCDQDSVLEFGIYH